MNLKQYMQTLREDGGILLLNPGAAMDHHWAFLDISDDGRISATLR